MPDTPSPDMHGLGERFRKARELAGWSIQETAESLHIIPRYVSAIENERFSELPGVVFLKGYVKSYARLLGMAEGPVLAQLDEILTSRNLSGGNGPQIPADLTDNPAAAKRSTVGLWLLGLGVIVVGGLYWFAQSGREAVPAVESTSGPEAQEAIVAVEADTEMPEAEPVAEAASEADGSDDGEAMALEDEMSALEASAPEPVQAGQSVELQIALPPAEAPLVRQSGFQPVDGAVRASEPEVAVPDSEPEPSGEAGAQAQVAVSARFIGDCWFDVRDANNKRVVRLFREGQSVTFTGEAPLSFVVGAVDKAIVSIDGAPVNFQSYPIRNNRVEFSWEQD